MTGETHLKVGVCLGAITLNPTILVWSMAGSLLPDIDHPSTSINKYFSFASTFNFHHRGLAHSFIVATIISLLVYAFFGAYAAIGMLIGYTSHIITDCFTPKGVAILAPITSQKVHLGAITTGSAAESVFVMVVTLLSVAYFGYTQNWPIAAIWSAASLVACILASTNIKKYYLLSTFILCLIILTT